MPGLFATKTMVGVEIDDGEIRGVELEKHQGRLSLGSWGSYPLPDNAVKEGVILQPEKVGGALEELWRQEGFKQREIITGVSNQGVLVRFASFPQVPPEKLDGVIRFQAQDHLPVPLP
ncbi:MAG TPA: pilus assembly protein PilM [Clostridia bacterium]|nr:pilus assembly protein PilM [Clostridia bacterium]